MKKHYDLVIYLFLLLSPFIDCITGLQERFNIPFSVGSIIRGIIMVLGLFYLFKNHKNRNNIYLFLIYIIIEFIYTFTYLRTSVFTEFKNLLVIFYLPMMILFFSEYKNEKIDKNLFVTINFIYLFSIILPFLFGSGFNTYGGNDGKSTFLGFFFEGNELSALLILLFPLTLDYLFKERKFVHLFIYLVLYFICIIIIGTKVLLLGTLIVLLYFAFKELHKVERKKRFICIIGILLFLGLCVMVLPFTPVYKNLVISMDYYGVKSLFDLFKPSFIDKIVFSNRISYAVSLFKVYTSNIIYIIFGMGKYTLITLKDAEIDLIDIVFSIGVIGTIIYAYSFNNKVFKLNGIYKFIFILLFIISLFSGHVLIKPMVATFLALLFFFNKETQDI